MSDAVLVVDRVFKDYGGQAVTHALSDVSVSLAAGEFAALIGPSGSGKSTLLNVIGLLDLAGPAVRPVAEVHGRNRGGDRVPVRRAPVRC